MKTIFDICTPRKDVLKGSIKESDFAADLAQVLNGTAPKEYSEPELFFANTHPTVGLKSLLHNVCLRLLGKGGEASSIFRLDTQYGGGKTHALIALCHAANGMKGVSNVSEFLDPGLVLSGKVNVAAFDGENADVVNGRSLGDGIKAYTPWGELAYALAGSDGYKQVSKSDVERVSPGADTIRSLFGGKPTLILLDELSIYLRKVMGRPEAGQLTPFLTALFKAVESSPQTALVFTLAIGKGGKATDAYSEEQEFIAKQLEEAESVAARKATPLDPTKENETAQVLRRRLFSKIDESAAEEVIEAYRDLWVKYAEDLPTPRKGEDWVEEFRNGYPFHPALMSTLTDKLSTLNNFQRVRGMLRLLTQTVADLWKKQPKNTFGIHLHNIDPGHNQIHNEIVTRLNLGNFDPAIRNDVSSDKETSLAQHLDTKEYSGLEPYGSFIARTILWHSFAFNEHLKGVSSDQLRFSIHSPGSDLTFINNARQKFISSSAYLDDRPAAPMRFLTEANLKMMILRKENDVDPEEARSELRDRIKKIFSGKVLNLVPFASGPYDVDDDAGDGRPNLVLISYDADTVRSDKPQIPDLVEKIYSTHGTQEKFRKLQNNLMFLVGDHALFDSMKKKMNRRLALEIMVKSPDTLKELADHQQEKIKELYQRSEQELAIAIQQCYRHLFFPSRNNRVEGAGVDLGHAVFDIQDTSDKPGAGQNQILRALDDNHKLLRSEDQPLAPSYIRDHTPLKNGLITTADLRSEFRKDPRLPMMIGDDNFVRMIHKGINENIFVYKSGELLFGQGDPPAQIRIDAQAFVFTLQYAKDKNIWPRPIPEKEPDEQTGEGDKKPDKPETEPETEATAKDKFHQETTLREALTRIWEDARTSEVKFLSRMTIRVIDVNDAFRLLTPIGSISKAISKVKIEAEYETSLGSSLELVFNGLPQDVEPLKEFLLLQFRASSEKNMETEFIIDFTEGLNMESDQPEKVLERLTRLGTSAAMVEIDAEIKE